MNQLSEMMSGLLALLLMVAVIVGIPLLLSDWLRQRRAAREQAAYLQAWRDAQDKEHRDHLSLQREAMTAQRQHTDRALAWYDQDLALRQRFLQVADEHLAELKRLNQVLQRLAEVRDSRE